MNTSTFSGEYIDANLRQMNATKIKVISGKVHIVDFDLGDGYEVTYVFSLTNEKRFHLQRANPYAMIHGKFANEKEILAFIKSDIAKFKNAKMSKNYNKFISAATDVLALTEDIENMFMSRNVSPEDLKSLHDEVQRLKQHIQAVTEKSPVLTTVMND